MRFSFLQKFRKKNQTVTLPHRLHRRQVFIIPTRHGTVFMAVLFGMFLGSANYNNNLGFLLSFLLGSMMFVSILHTARNLTGLTLKNIISRNVFAGEQAAFQLAVQISGASRQALSFRFGKNKPEMTASLPPGTHQINISVPTEKRGILTPGPLIIVTRYPLGLFRAWAELNIDISSLVYPKPSYGPILSRNGGSGTESEEGGAAGPGAEDFQGLKIYQPGDALQHISWKAFSKGQGVLTKTFVSLSGDSIVLEWDVLKNMTVEAKLSKLCGMVIQADRAGMAYGLNLPGVSLEPARGETHKHLCLKALACFNKLPKDHHEQSTHL